ncbi:hypothetical protein XELAEV_18039307mg [Xenopus laevis]|uniref:PH domain-containing protein n=1 Tax=Xenopus laevis TaxID=8355 RepID=A0A974H883_XENLA|nr:hypothetical protein XELAEV_18039307mg [Xenopus laevis]
MLFHPVLYHKLLYYLSLCGVICCTVNHSFLILYILLYTHRSWVNLYCVLNKGDIGVYKDAKSQSSGATHGGEPLLNLLGASCEVASEYKKKKFVFKLRSTDGRESLFQAKDEEEMKNWITAITTCVSEHAEIARWSQSLLTTSSTDESNIKRESDRRPSGGGRKK